MMRATGDSKYSVTQRTLCDAQAHSTGASPEDLVGLAEQAQELARELLNDAARELERRHRKVRPIPSLGEHTPYRMAQRLLDMADRDVQHGRRCLKDAERLLNTLSWQGGLVAYRDVEE